MKIARLLVIALLGAGLAAATLAAAENRAHKGDSPIFVERKLGQSPPAQTIKETFVELLPDMGNESAPKFSAAQQQWQEICFAAGAPGNGAMRAEVVKLMSEKLGSGTPPAARIWLLKQLERLGDGQCVDAIAPALDDACPLVRDAARRALANNPAPEALGKLRAKLASAKDPEFKTGLINALGDRADASSIAAIAKELSDPDAAIAAARALGKIGTREAQQTLAAARPKATGEVRLWIDDSCLLCADELLRAEKADEAHVIYEGLSRQGEPRATRMAALKGLLKTAGGQAAGIILEKLAGSDADARNVAVAFLITAECRTTYAVVAGMGKLPPDAQVTLLGVLGSKRYQWGRAAVLEVAKSQNEKVKIAALAALGGVGDASVAPLLVETMLAGKEAAPEVVAAARTSLETMFAADVDEKLIAIMQGTTDVAHRALLIEVLERRRAKAAVHALLAEIQSKDAGVRRYAMSALGLLAGAKDVATILQAMLNVHDAAERGDAERAVTLICGRIPDEADRAEPVLAVYQAASDADKNALLPVLGRIGCSKTRDLIQTALAAEDPKRREAGFCALCNWPDVTGADDLLNLYDASKDADHRMRALRAFSRTIGDSHQGTDAKKLVMLKRAMQVALTDAERTVLLDRAATVRDIQTLRLILPLLESPKLKEPACRAICNLAHDNALRSGHKAEFAKALDRVIQESKDRGLVERAKADKTK